MNLSSIKFCNDIPQFILSHIKGYSGAIDTSFNNFGGIGAIDLIGKIREVSHFFGLIFKNFDKNL